MQRGANKGNRHPPSERKVEIALRMRSAQGGSAVVEPRLHYRDVKGTEHICTLVDARAGMLADASPWRPFRWHHGQRHYSGTYWCATTRGHVVYESRLELARLILADFDPLTVGIAAQPFLIEARATEGTRRHVPDFLLVDTEGLVTVVNVKPSDRLADPKVAESLAWAAELFRARGWRPETWSGLDEVTMANLRFLAGYRRTVVINPEALTLVEEAVRPGDTIADVECRLGKKLETSDLRPAILHLVWTGALIVDLAVPLSRDAVLGRVA
jgi:hypothetical protein